MDANGINRLGRCFEREAGGLVLYARQWLEPTAAEDAVQDAFVSLMNTPRWPDNPKAWLYRAVRYGAHKSLRTARRRSEREARETEAAPPWLESRAEETLDARAAEQALRALPAEEREVVTLRIWGGLTLEEVSAIVDSSIATVFRRYRSGLQRMRQQLESPCTLTTS